MPKITWARAVSPHRALERIRRDHPCPVHGVCMSIGGPQPLDRTHLERFRALVERYEPALVSEHLAWSTHETTYFNDLLPLPYTEATLNRVSDHIDEVQEAIGRSILLENPSTYVVLSRVDDEPKRISFADWPAHWLRLVARRQQRLRIVRPTMVIPRSTISSIFRSNGWVRSIWRDTPSRPTTKAISCSSTVMTARWRTRSGSSSR